MSSAIESIALHDDVAVVRATEKLLERLALAFGPIADSIVAGLRNMPENENGTGRLLAYLDEHADDRLDALMSVIEARRLMVTAAGQPHLDQLVAACLADWPENRNSVGLALTYGSLITLWLMILTTEVRLEDASPVKGGEKTIILQKKACLPDIAVELTRRGVKLELKNACTEPGQAVQAPSPAPGGPVPAPHR